MKTFPMTAVLAAALVAAGAGAGVAAAKPGQGERGAMMAARLAEMDLNKDGKITKVEAETVRLKMFDRLDADKSGVVTAAEMTAARQAMAAAGGKGGKGDPQMRGMDRLDGDNDGQVTRAEAQAAPYPMFERLDANKDGAIDKTEMPTWGGS